MPFELSNVVLSGFTIENLTTGSSVTAGDAGIEGLRLRVGSLRADQLTFRLPVNKIEQATQWAFGDRIVLRDRGGVIRFKGKRVAMPLEASGPAEYQHYLFAGPWWDLENRVFHQLWTTWIQAGGNATSSQSYNPHVILNVGRTVAQEITDIIGYAASQGVDIAAGTIEAPVYPPPDEVTNRDCASLILQLASYAPDCVGWFQYDEEDSNAAPIFHFRRAANLGTHSVPAFGALGSEDLTIEARHQDVATAVAIRYERLDELTDNGVTKQYPVIVNDVAPVGATGREERAVSVTVQLAGFQKTTIKAQIVCASFPADFESAAAIADFWSRPQFNLPITDDRIEPSTLNITAGSFVRSAAQSEDETDIPTYIDHPRYLIAGEMAPWMVDSSGGALAWQRQVLSADFNWTAYDDTSFQNFGVIDKVTNKRLPVYLIATNAPEGVTEFTTTTSFTEGEQPAIGLAQYLYDQLSVLGYQGTRRHIQSECDFDVTMGLKLRLTGGDPAWATMDALIQEIEYELDSGTTNVTFGVAPLLSLGRILELLRNARTLRRWTAVEQRDDGTLTEGADAELGRAAPDTNSVPALQTNTYYAVKDNLQKVSIDATNRIILIEKSDESAKFIKAYHDSGVTEPGYNVLVQDAPTAYFRARANSNEATMEVFGGSGQILCRSWLCNGKILYPREETWCDPDTGARRKIMVLCSEPYD